MKKHVLFVTGDLEIGGTQWHLVQLLPQLAEKDIRPAVYTIMQKGQLAGILERAGIEVIEPPFASFLRKVPQPFRRLAVILLSGIKLYCVLWRRPQVVHFYLPMAYLMGGLESLFVPLRWRVMSRRSLNLYQFAHPLLARIERCLHRKMDVVSGNATPVMDDLRAEGIPDAKSVLIYNGVDLSRFDELPGRAETRGQLGLGNETLTLIMVANFLPSKGHFDLLVALARIRDRLPADWCLLLAGSDYGCRAELETTAAEYGLADKVRFLDERHDVPALYAAADLGVLSSHQEGFSNSVLEGMAARLPMIVTRTGGNTEAIVDGDCGLVVPVRRPDILGDAIMTLAADPDLRSRYGLRARQRVERHFSMAACVEQYLQFYNALGGDEASSLAAIAAIAAKKTD